MRAEEIAERIKTLCKAKGMPVSKMLEECNLAHSLVSNMANGMMPAVDKCQTIAEYLGVPLETLLGTSRDEAVQELLEFYATRPEARILFSVAKDATAEDIAQAVKIIEALKK